MCSVEAVLEARACPFCGGEILAKALQCRHCRKWMPEVIAPARPAAAPGFSSGQPLHHLVLLSVFTLGLYEVYWFWRNWRDLRDNVGIDTKPAWRTVGLLVPIVNVAIVYQQLHLVREIATARGVSAPYSPLALTAAFFALALAGNLTLIWLLALLNVFALVPVQQTLNRLWEVEQPGAQLRERFVAHEMAAMVAGVAATAAALLATAG